MESSSAGRIKAHNLHLLVGDQEDVMDQKAQRPQSAGSHSSEDSRQMDQSPTGNQSDDSLEAEMKYQEELKERLRASFADLGMDPRGVLRDSLDEDDLRDSLDVEPENQLVREGTFIKDDKGDDDLQDSLDATQDANNDDDDISVQDSLDGEQDQTLSSEPTSQDIKDYKKTIDNHMVAYPLVDPTLKSTRQSSGGSTKSAHNGSKPSSRRNSRDGGKNSPKVASTLVRLKDSPSHRLKDSPSHRKPPSGHGSTKPVAIPGINTHSREPTPADGTAREHTRPKLTKTHSKVHRLDSGEEVRVEYISDESDDEDMHFVDEKGSPVDNYGIPLNVGSEMSRQYRIVKKPMPPKEPSPREQQVLNSRRTSSGKVPRSGGITRTENEQVGLSEGSKLPQHNGAVQELLIQKTEEQPLGSHDSTLPPQQRFDSSKSSSKRRLDSANHNGLFGDVRVSSNTSGGGSYSAQKSPSKKRNWKDPDPYGDLRFDIDAVKKAAAEQEAALRMQSNSKDRQRTSSPTNKSNNRNNSGNNPEQNKHEPSFDNVRHPEQVPPPGGQFQQHPQQQPFVDDSFIEPQQDSRPEEINKYLTPQSEYSQRSDTQMQDSYQYNGSGQPSWQGPANQAMQQGMNPNQPIRTQVQHGGQYLQGPPQQEPEQFFDYQQQQPPQQQFIQMNQPPMDVNYPQNPQAFPVNHQHPMQSGFEPSLSNSYQQPDMGQYMQQSEQWQYQQQADYSLQPQHQQPNQFQPPQQPNVYGGQFMQGSGQFNQGFNPNMQLQYDEQYHAEQMASAPNMAPQRFAEYNTAPGNAPSQINQQYNPGPRIPFSQPGQPIPQRQVQSGPTISRRPPRQQPVRAGPDFISRNKQYLKFGAPKKTYQQVYSMIKQDTQTQTPPLNPNVPLPSISRENSHDAGEELNTWAELDDERWTRALVEEQKQMALLMRGQSESNIVTGVYQQAPSNVRNSHGTQASWSADHATAYARMQASQQQQQISPRTRVMFDDDMYNSFESEDLRSPRGQSNSHPNSKRTSPYPALPGIPSHRRESPLRTSDPDGYLVKLQKAKQRPQYKEYTLKDYRNLKKDMRLGGLGPDSDIIAEKQEKINRQRDYAKAVMQQNKKVLHQTKQKPWRNKSTTPTNRQPETPSRRNIAMEYAKKIPKPRIPTPPDQVHERLYGSSLSMQEEDHQEAVAMEMSRLEELKARHMKEKEQVDKLRTEIPT